MVGKCGQECRCRGAAPKEEGKNMERCLIRSVIKENFCTLENFT